MISGSNSQRWWWHLSCCWKFKGYSFWGSILTVTVVERCFFLSLYFQVTWQFTSKHMSRHNNLQHTHRKNRDKKNTQNYLSIHMFKRSQGKGLLFFCFLLLRSGKMFLPTASLLIIFLFPNHFSSCFPNVGINNTHD